MSRRIAGPAGGFCRVRCELVDRHRNAVYPGGAGGAGFARRRGRRCAGRVSAGLSSSRSFPDRRSFQDRLLTIAWHHAISRRRSLPHLLQRLAENGEVEAGVSRAKEALELAVQKQTCVKLRGGKSGSASDQDALAETARRTPARAGRRVQLSGDRRDARRAARDDQVASIRGAAHDQETTSGTRTWRCRMNVWIRR
jgi:hypothetical protein